jgi:hypothetical protein
MILITFAVLNHHMIVMCSVLSTAAQQNYTRLVKAEQSKLLPTINVCKKI